MRISEQTTTTKGLALPTQQGIRPNLQQVQSRSHQASIAALGKPEAPVLDIHGNQKLKLSQFHKDGFTKIYL
jgi:hypothetical protein